MQCIMYSPIVLLSEEERVHHELGTSFKTHVIQYQSLHIDTAVRYARNVSKRR
jgi:hypothetical protein